MVSSLRSLLSLQVSYVMNEYTQWSNLGLSDKMPTSKERICDHIDRRASMLTKTFEQRDVEDET